MFIKEEKKIIEMTAAEYKNAMTYGTEEFEALCRIRELFPGFKPAVVSTKNGKSDFAKLDMKTIKAYVLKHGSDEQKEKFAFISKRTIGEDGEYCEAQPFFQIKKWFLDEFPELKQERKDYRMKVLEIYQAAADKVA